MADINQFVITWLQRAKASNEKKRDTIPWDSVGQLSKAAWIMGIFQVVLIILFATVGGDQIIVDNYPGTGTQGYNMFIGVEIMMFVGFGYLMTFLKWYGLGAVGFTMVLTAVALQWVLFTESFFDQIYNNTEDWHYVHMDIYALLNCLYAVSAVLISFGALIGKASPAQLLVMAIIELVCHSFNYKVLMIGVMKLQDMGGTYIDHMFGAYFGLAVSYMLGKPKAEPEFGYTGDIFSMIGTVFLWIYWPSFVAGAAEADSEQQQRAIVNTILAMSASTVCAFWLSSVLAHNGRYRPVDIQNATLAGGVAIGCSANFTMSCFGAIMIGGTAGLVSCYGFNYIMPWMEDRIGLHDSCGIHNLHAMPSVIGALATVILTGYKGSDGRSHDHEIFGSNVHSQWWRQWVSIILCMSFAIFSGLFTGLVLKAVYPTSDPASKQFHDESYWEVADDYGRSLYSELVNILGEGDESSAVKSSVMASMPEWSSHSGRRRQATEKPMEMGVVPSAAPLPKANHTPVSNDEAVEMGQVHDLARTLMDDDA